MKSRLCVSVSRRVMWAPFSPGMARLNSVCWLSCRVLGAGGAQKPRRETMQVRAPCKGRSAAISPRTPCSLPGLWQSKAPRTQTQTHADIHTRTYPFFSLKPAFCSCLSLYMDVWRGAGDGQQETKDAKFDFA